MFSISSFRTPFGGKAASRRAEAAEDIAAILDELKTLLRGPVCSAENMGSEPGYQAGEKYEFSARFEANPQRGPLLRLPVMRLGRQAVLDNRFKEVRPAESLAAIKEVYRINRVKWETAHE